MNNPSEQDRIRQWEAAKIVDVTQGTRYPVQIQLPEQGALFGFFTQDQSQFTLTIPPAASMTMYVASNDLLTFQQARANSQTAGLSRGPKTPEEVLQGILKQWEITPEGKQQAFVDAFSLDYYSYPSDMNLPDLGVTINLTPNSSPDAPDLNGFVHKLEEVLNWKVAPSLKTA